MAYEHDGKNYLIIGASSGIGESIAIQLARDGASLAMLARRKDCMEQVRQSLTPGSHQIYPFDVSNLVDIDRMVGTITADYPSISGCVYCAGVGDTSRLRDLSSERLHYVMQVNFYAFVEFVRCLVRRKKKETEMRIVAISSLASICNDKYFTPYAASKAALDASVRCLARELASKKVTINSIRPGVVNVARLSALDELTGGLDEEIKRNGYQPLGLIPPEDIACMVSYLLSDSARFITGSNIPFNGGAAC